jgi:hypothetical protein
VNDNCKAIFDTHDSMGANLLAHSTTSTLVLEKFKGRYTLQVHKAIHYTVPPPAVKRAVNQRTSAVKTAVI